MATGFIYIVTSLTKDYVQKKFYNVPTEWKNRLYFGPCKEMMRPKMKSGDFIFGISSWETHPRRILFAAKIEERITFKEAYERFPSLHGPEGPIHVKPIQGTGSFPASNYEHISFAMHGGTKWQRDLATPERDAFFVCGDRVDWQGRWLGVRGPKINDEILSFLKTCSVHKANLLSKQNIDAIISNPIRHRGPKGFGNIGLHLETSQPEALLELMDARITAKPSDLDRLPVPKPSTERSVGLGCSKSSPTCG